MSKIAKILLVEDDPNLGLITKDFLEMSGYEVHLTIDGEKGFKAYISGGFDLCILDVMLPLKDGFTLATEIREINTQIPIIFLTAKALNEDVIKGLKIGADDYITKPFHTEELNLRIKSILRRTIKQTIENDLKTIEIGAYIFDIQNQELIHASGKQILTKREADLLKLFCDNMNNVITREYALTQIWGTDDYFLGRSMDVFISRLRKYLKADSNIQLINVHGTGFKLSVDKV